jgi:hypothetical protein
MQYHSVHISNRFLTVAFPSESESFIICNVQNNLVTFAEFEDNRVKESVGTVLYLLTYLLTPWCRILFEELIITQLVKKYSAFYGTRKFITVFTQARHWTLS